MHLVGFTTGIILYTMLGVMTRRRPSYVVAPSEREPDDRVPLAAAGFGVVWNVGAMLVYAVRDFGLDYPLPWVGAVAYTALGFLPAVVVHSTLRRFQRSRSRLSGRGVRGERGGGCRACRRGCRRPTVFSFRAAPADLHVRLLLGALAISERRQPGFQRSITAVALAAFAVSALHLSRAPGTTDQDPWVVELIGHHASLPLVLAILYQDYRFAFADLFLKRALSLLALVGVVSLLYAGVVAPLVDPHAIAARRSIDEGSHLAIIAALVGLWIATALAYPFIQRRIYRFVDRVILGRTDYREFRAATRPTARSVSRRRRRARRDLRAAGCTPSAPRRHRGTRATTETRLQRPSDDHARRSSRAEAVITIPTAIQPSYEIRVAELERRDARCCRTT